MEHTRYFTRAASHIGSKPKITYLESSDSEKTKRTRQGSTRKKAIKRESKTTKGEIKNPKLRKPKKDGEREKSEKKSNEGGTQQDEGTLWYFDSCSELGDPPRDDNEEFENIVIIEERDGIEYTEKRKIRKGERNNGLIQKSEKDVAVVDAIIKPTQEPNLSGGDRLGGEVSKGKSLVELSDDELSSTQNEKDVKTSNSSTFEEPRKDEDKDKDKGKGKEEEVPIDQQVSISKPPILEPPKISALTLSLRGNKTTRLRSASTPNLKPRRSTSINTTNQKTNLEAEELGPKRKKDGSIDKRYISRAQVALMKQAEDADAARVVEEVKAAAHILVRFRNGQCVKKTVSESKRKRKRARFQVSDSEDEGGEDPINGPSRCPTGIIDENCRLLGGKGKEREDSEGEKGGKQLLDCNDLVNISLKQPSIPNIPQPPPAPPIINLSPYPTDDQVPLRDQHAIPSQQIIRLMTRFIPSKRSPLVNVVQADSSSF